MERPRVPCADLEGNGKVCARLVLTEGTVVLWGGGKAQGSGMKGVGPVCCAGWDACVCVGINTSRREYWAVCVEGERWGWSLQVMIDYGVGDDDQNIYRGTGGPKGWLDRSD